MDDVALDHQVFVNEVGGKGIVGVNAADFGGSQDNDIGAFGLQEIPDTPLIGQVQLGMRAGDDVRLAARFQLT